MSMSLRKKDSGYYLSSSKHEGISSYNKHICVMHVNVDIKAIRKWSKSQIKKFILKGLQIRQDRNHQLHTED